MCMTIDYIKFHSIPKGGKAYIFEIQQRIQEKGRKRRTGMQSPFDVKNKAASAIDRLALRLLLFALCVFMLLGSTYNPFIYFRF